MRVWRYFTSTLLGWYGVKVICFVYIYLPLAGSSGAAYQRYPFDSRVAHTPGTLTTLRITLEIFSKVCNVRPRDAQPSNGRYRRG